MRTQRLAAVGATLLATTLALSACGTRSSDTGDGGTGTGSGGEGSQAKTAKIGVISPLSGDLSALGLGIQNSVDLAIQQANESKAIPGWTLELDAQDDQATPDVGRNAATKLGADEEVVGVVGTLNSSVAQSVQPVLASATVAMVSPANTNPALSQGAKFDTAPKRPYENYFRTATTDSVQGPFAARYLYNNAKITKVATIHDKKAYGQGLVEAFAGEFKKLGGQVVTAETINPDDKNFGSVITKVKSASPGAIYYGGEYPQSGPLSQQAKAAGVKVPLMGGDGMYSGEYIKLAGKSSAGDLATSVGAPVAELESAKSFVDAYKAAGFSEDYEAYGAYAYDAANALIEALKKSLPDAESAKAARQPTIDALADVSFDGATGAVAFDEYGDTTTKVLTVYKVTKGKWAPALTEEFK